PRASLPTPAGAAARSARSHSTGASTAPRISAAASGGISACRRASTARDSPDRMHSPSRIVWQPPADRLDLCALSRFAEFARDALGAPWAQGDAAQRWESLHAWSVAQRADFWRGLWDFAGVIGERGALTLQQ